MTDDPHRLSAKLSANRAAWNQAADRYDDHSDNGLPNWGPYRVCRHDATLIGPIKGKSFLEIGFGAGYSIRYLMENGAGRVTGIDISDRQTELAAERNRRWLDQGKVHLVCSPMEERISRDVSVDTVLSVFALGWSTDLPRTLKNISSYLKPGGRLVFSWEHPLFPITEFAGDRVHFCSPYFRSGEHEETKWEPGATAFMHARTVADWFGELRQAGFRIDRYLEPAPEHFSARQQDVANGQYYYQRRALMVPATMIFVCSKPD
jgi:SAM-dependent methyltransferase